MSVKSLMHLLCTCSLSRFLARSLTHTLFSVSRDFLPFKKEGDLNIKYLCNCCVLIYNLLECEVFLMLLFAFKVQCKQKRNAIFHILTCTFCTSALLRSSSLFINYRSRRSGHCLVCLSIVWLYMVAFQLLSFWLNSLLGMCVCFYCEDESNSRKHADSYSLSSEVGEVEADEIPELDSLILLILCALVFVFEFVVVSPTFSDNWSSLRSRYLCSRTSWSFWNLLFLSLSSRLRIKPLALLSRPNVVWRFDSPPKGTNSFSLSRHPRRCARLFFSNSLWVVRLPCDFLNLFDDDERLPPPPPPPLLLLVLVFSSRS